MMFSVTLFHEFHLKNGRAYDIAFTVRLNNNAPFEIKWHNEVIRHLYRVNF